MQTTPWRSTISGAGVIFVHNDEFILARCCIRGSEMNKFSGFGGLHDQITPYLTASKEVFEESDGTINVSDAYLQTKPFVEVRCSNNTCYLAILVTDMQVSCSTFYQTRRNIVSLGGTPNHETDRMTRFPVKQFKDEYTENMHVKGPKMSDQKVTDRNEVATISQRTLKAIGAFFASGKL
jgi:hypothetical protein